MEDILEGTPVGWDNRTVNPLGFPAHRPTDRHVRPQPVTHRTRANAIRTP
ncbi:hypothetical protein FTUN_8487 [Frigoriglobus tundricola]|uniref:Uncharacterized protein n=1 Tax=Frigoriglobus tundricola TaxID=2774151 RepID=A0A6M5Z3K6_9BACT|nr:hypothetical protein FTUN_8487 [Frigoriglobus tundricola]